MELYTLKECKKKPIKKKKSKYELYANKMVIKKKGEETKTAILTLVFKSLCYHYAIFWKFSNAAP